MNINDRSTPYSCAEMIELELKGVDVNSIDKALLPAQTRIVEPGSVITMDHIPTRLNLIVDNKGIISRAYCG